MADALVRLVAGSVHAIRVPNALIALGSLPAEATLALVRLRAVALVAARRTNRVQTVGALPAVHANDGALLGASVVAVDVVSGPTEDVALFAIVVRLASDSVRVRNGGQICLVNVVGPVILDVQVAVH